ncbi:MAG: helix-turn-helix transcriptional regulator [Bacillota bacterium]
MSIFNERITQLKNELGITSRKLGETIGVAPSIVCRWCKNSNSISLANAIVLCDYFQCSLDFLSGRTDEDIKTSFLQAPPFKDRLREVLKKENITVYKICKETQLSNGYFFKWYNGADPKLSTLEILANYLNITLDYLVGRE